MKHFAITVALLMAGCAGAAGMQRQAPKMSLTSTKSPDALEECLSLNAGLGTPTTIRGEGRRILSWQSRDIAIAAITIINGTPNVVEVRWSLRLHSKLRRRIEACL